MAKPDYIADHYESIHNLKLQLHKGEEAFHNNVKKGLDDLAGMYKLGSKYDLREEHFADAKKVRSVTDKLTDVYIDNLFADLKEDGMAIKFDGDAGDAKAIAQFKDNVLRAYLGKTADELKDIFADQFLDKKGAYDFDAASIGQSFRATQIDQYQQQTAFDRATRDPKAEHVFHIAEKEFGLEGLLNKELLGQKANKDKLRELYSSLVQTSVRSPEGVNPEKYKLDFLSEKNRKRNKDFLHPSKH